MDRFNPPPLKKQNFNTPPKLRLKGRIRSLRLYPVCRIRIRVISIQIRNPANKKKDLHDRYDALAYTINRDMACQERFEDKQR